jgi:hypothetical protein
MVKEYKMLRYILLRIIEGTIWGDDYGYTDKSKLYVVDRFEELDDAYKACEEGDYLIDALTLELYNW